MPRIDELERRVRTLADELHFNVTRFQLYEDRYSTDLPTLEIGLEQLPQGDDREAER